MKYLMEKKFYKKIIFLDYDGVVNNLVFHTIDGEPTYYCEEWNDEKRDFKVNDFQAIAWLNKICREFDAAVVVSSTWRMREDYDECLYRAGFKGEILGRTPQLSETIPHETRGREIFDYLCKEKNIRAKLEDFIILDDDADMWIFKDHLIQTNTYRGLGYEEYEKICKRWEKKKKDE